MCVCVCARTRANVFVRTLVMLCVRAHTRVRIGIRLSVSRCVPLGIHNDDMLCLLRYTRKECYKISRSGVYPVVFSKSPWLPQVVTATSPFSAPALDAAAPVLAGYGTGVTRNAHQNEINK